MAARAATAAILALALLVLGAPGALARNLALVIGNNDYRNVARLGTAVSDALAIGDELEKLGFVVRRAVDVDQRAMSRALSAFDADLQPGDQAFFFYAGHGLEISGANYLLPTDVPAAQANQRDLVRDAAIPVERIVDGIRESGARVTILVLDACRDNPFAAAGTRSAAISGGLARVDAGEGVFVLMSAGAKQQALDRLSGSDGAKNSVFTRSFLQEMATPGRTLVQIAKATQIKVKDLAASVGYEQTPAYYDQVIGDVVLAGSTPGPVASIAPLAPGRIEARSPSPPQLATLPPPTAPVVPPPGTPQLATPQLATPQLGGPQLGGRAPIASFMRSNAGWTATISLPEPALELSYRIGESGAFKPTGLSDTLDQRTGERQPNLSFPLAAGTPATILQLRYTTPDGGSVGPFAIPFDPDAALFREQKRILEQMPSKWVEFRDGDGVLAYFTMLIVYRCAITELRYGLDEAKPLARYDLPACNPKEPFSVPAAARILMKVPPRTRGINLQITWRDGTQSEVNSIPRD